MIPSALPDKHPVDSLLDFLTSSKVLSQSIQASQLVLLYAEAAALGTQRRSVLPGAALVTHLCPLVRAPQGQLRDAQSWPQQERHTALVHQLQSQTASETSLNCHGRRHDQAETAP